MSDYKLGEAIVKMGTRGYLQQKAIEKAKRTRRICKVYAGYYVAYPGELIEIVKTIDGWNVYGMAPDGAYDWTFDYFKEARSVVSGMLHEAAS